MMAMRKVTISTVACMLAVCAILSAGQAAADDEMRVSKAVWAKFAAFKNQLTPSSDEYFAASSDGGWAWNTDKDEAVKQCQQYAKSECVVFAHNEEILVPYHVD